MAYLGTAAAILSLMFAMLRYFDGRIDKKFERVDQKLEAMNQRIFDLAMALRPHIQEVQDQRVPVSL